jgi:hypothetical protein
MNVIGPFLTDSMIFTANDLATAPRIVATQEDRVALGRGDKAYVSGQVGNTRNWEVFRPAQPIVDPDTKEVLGYEARYVGSAEHLQDGEARPGAAKTDVEVPSTFVMTSARIDGAVGDRLMPSVVNDFAPFVPHAPHGPMNGAVASLFGDALSAGSNQVVALNRGSRDGLERGNVLALWHEGALTNDKSVEHGSLIKLPDERIGLLFVFRVFDRMSYALIMEGTQPVLPGDRFSAP